MFIDKCLLCNDNANGKIISSAHQKKESFSRGGGEVGDCQFLSTNMSPLSIQKLQNAGLLDIRLCCSKKYLPLSPQSSLLSHERFGGWNPHPHPSGNSRLDSYCCLKMLAFGTPPLSIFRDLPGNRCGYSLEPTEWVFFQSSTATRGITIGNCDKHIPVYKKANRQWGIYREGTWWPLS